VFRKVAAAAEPAVVMVSCADYGVGGSGFLISPDGYVLTNNHVVHQITVKSGAIAVSYSSAINVLVAGVWHPATVANDLSADPPVVYDYAILKVDGLAGAPWLPIGDLKVARRGDLVLCLGFPLDFDSVIATDGIISALIQRPSHINSLHQMQTIVSNVLLQFGNSGGPMIHFRSGKVIGINTLPHELRDPLGRKLKLWSKHPTSDAFPLVRDLIDYTLHYTYVGLNHAVSIEYASQDPAWPTPIGGTS
jgi:S1-C subfamily serine protease